MDITLYLANPGLFLRLLRIPKQERRHDNGRQYHYEYLRKAKLDR